MSWRIVRLIYAREILDQFRDRRTVFMIAVLPLLLYPLLGMTVFQLSQFMRKHEARVVIVGAEQLEKVPNLPPLFEAGHFAPGTLGDPAWGERITLEFAPPPIWQADPRHNNQGAGRNRPGHRVGQNQQLPDRQRC